MAGRPKKVPEKSNSAPIKDQTEKFEKLLADMQAKYENTIEQLQQQINVLSTPTPTVKSENKINKERKYKYIPHDVRIVVKSNVSGLFTYQDDRKTVRLFMEISDFGQTYELTYEEFSVLYTSKPHYFKKGLLAIVDVIAPDDLDITVDDIIVNKQLQNVYYNENYIDPRYIVEAFSNDMNAEDFYKLIKASAHLKETILEIGCALYKKGLFHDNAKMNYMKIVYQNQNLFK